MPPGTHVWDELKDIIYVVETYSPDNMVPLAGKILPELNGFGIKLSPNDTNDKMILVCFFDYENHLSRNCILELNVKEDELKEKDIKVVAVQTSKIDNNVLNEWVNENSFNFTIGVIESDVEQTKFNWGVKASPWLILTDKEHIVQAEGFSITELDEKIKL